jgi:hypothetical protein
VDVRAFVDQLLPALAQIKEFSRVAVDTEGPVVDGYAFVDDALFLRFYFNEITDTTAFALIKERNRVWGMDFDNRRGWHRHPFGEPNKHVAVNVPVFDQIMDELGQVLMKLASE